MKLAAVAARLDAYEKLVRLDKPVGILLLLWPTLWGLWIAAAGVPDWRVLWIFVMGTVLMRSAGCAINDYADRGFDAHVKRIQSGLPALALEADQQVLDRVVQTVTHVQRAGHVRRRDHDRVRDLRPIDDGAERIALFPEAVDVRFHFLRFVTRIHVGRHGGPHENAGSYQRPSGARRPARSGPDEPEDERSRPQ